MYPAIRLVTVGWIVAKGTTGPFTTTTVIPTSAAEEIAAIPGVERADPLAYSRATIDGKTDVNILGVVPDGVGTPEIAEGRPATKSGEVVVDTALGKDIGDRFQMSGRDVEVVGTAERVTFNFGVPTVFITMEEAQDMVFGSQPLANAVITRGTPESVPESYVALEDDAVIKDLIRPMKSGTQTIDFINILLWIVAAGIIASIMYLSALERARDFAVLKAIGVKTSLLGAGLAIQAVVLCVAAAIVAAFLARLIAPWFQFTIELTARDLVRLPAIAVVVGLLASLIGLRRVAATDPAMAFG